MMRLMFAAALLAASFAVPAFAQGTYGSTDSTGSTATTTAPRAGGSATHPAGAAATHGVAGSDAVTNSNGKSVPLDSGVKGSSGGGGGGGK